MKSKFLLYLVTLASFLLAGTAAFYSVTGLSQLFSGASIAVMIMMGSLEFAKLVTASMLKKYWNDISVLMRIYLISAVMGLMVITSAGIYGFLSDAYQKTAIELEAQNNEILVLEETKKFLIAEKNQKTNQINQSQNRVNILTDQRSTQEVRLDSMLSRGWFRSARNTENMIAKADETITELNKDIVSLNMDMSELNDSINSVSRSVIVLKSNDISKEVGPLKYVSKIVDKSMDTVVNWLILLLIFVFDPLAICLIVAQTGIYNNKLSTDNEHDDIDVIDKINIDDQESKEDDPHTGVDKLMVKYKEKFKNEQKSSSIDQSNKTSDSDSMTVPVKKNRPRFYQGRNT